MKTVLLLVSIFLGVVTYANASERTLKQLCTPDLRSALDLPAHWLNNFNPEDGFHEYSSQMFEMFFRKNNIRFEINLDAARQNGLTISSKLLRLADIVRGSPGQIGERGH